MDLDGLAALVTGGGSGIGLGIARALAAEGCRVAIAGRDEARLRRAAETCHGKHPVLVHAADVADRAATDALARWAEQELGPLEIVVNSAGVNVPRRKMSELDPADFDRILAINCTGLYNLLHAVLPGMRSRRRGLVVSISSIAGKRALALAGPAYCASKFGASGLATAVGLEERPHGIRVTSIYPGEVNTPILDQRPVPVPEERKRVMVQPDDLGACVVMLARLPPHVIVPELIITPLYQDYA